MKVVRVERYSLAIQNGDTTVGELIEALQKLPEKATVYADEYSLWVTVEHPSM